MLLDLALLLSSRHEAEWYWWHEGAIGRKPRYRVSVYEVGEDKYNIAVEHAKYPDKTEGKGWGEEKFSGKYNAKQCTYPELKAFLDSCGIPFDNWEPVEEEE